MINTKANDVIGPTPGCVMRRTVKQTSCERQPCGARQQPEGREDLGQTQLPGRPAACRVRPAEMAAQTSPPALGSNSRTRLQYSSPAQRRAARLEPELSANQHAELSFSRSLQDLPMRSFPELTLGPKLKTRCRTDMRFACRWNPPTNQAFPLARQSTSAAKKGSCILARPNPSCQSFAGASIVSQKFAE